MNTPQTTEELARHLFRTFCQTPSGYNPTNPSLAEIAVKEIEGLIDEHVRWKIISHAHRDNIIRRQADRAKDRVDNIPPPASAAPSPIATTIAGQNVQIQRVQVAPRRV